jgi:hypothetical protein
MINVKELSKIEEIYLYVIKNSQSNVNFGSTLFNKILYFSDFDFYERHEKSITGDHYIHSEHGPTAKRFPEIIKELKEKKLIKEVRLERSKDHIQRRYILLEDFEPSQLAEGEILELDRNIGRLGGMTASQVSAYSHQDMPYKATEENEIIDYELVFYRDPVFSVNSEESEEASDLVEP